MEKNDAKVKNGKLTICLGQILCEFWLIPVLARFFKPYFFGHQRMVLDGYSEPTPNKFYRLPNTKILFPRVSKRDGPKLTMK